MCDFGNAVLLCCAWVIFVLSPRVFWCYSGVVGFVFLGGVAPVHALEHSAMHPLSRTLHVAFAHSSVYANQFR
jgi:hypothetical protein